MVVVDGVVFLCMIFFIRRISGSIDSVSLSVVFDVVFC